MNIPFLNECCARGTGAFFTRALRRDIRTAAPNQIPVSQFRSPHNVPILPLLQTRAGLKISFCPLGWFFITVKAFFFFFFMRVVLLEQLPRCGCPRILRKLAARYNRPCKKTKIAGGSAALRCRALYGKQAKRYGSKLSRRLSQWLGAACFR